MFVIQGSLRFWGRGIGPQDILNTYWTNGAEGWNGWGALYFAKRFATREEAEAEMASVRKVIDHRHLYTPKIMEIKDDATDVKV